MPYSAKARELRRCRKIKADGERCRAWAIWNHPEGYCATHAGVTGGKRPYRSLAGGFRRTPWQTGIVLQRARYPPCTCGAYAWPHRPGGGWCRWPDV
jgi:hypothetical protein